MADEFTPRLRGNTFFLFLLRAAKQELGVAPSWGTSTQGLTQTQLFMALMQTVDPTYQVPNVLMARKGVPEDQFNLMSSLAAWRKYKVMYNFEKMVATEVMEYTERPDKNIPLSYMTRLPYPCIAVHTCPIDIKDPNTDRIFLTTDGSNEMDLSSVA